MRFQEKTAAESGFSTVWEEQIAPHLRGYRMAYIGGRRKMILGIFLYFTLALPLMVYLHRSVDMSTEKARLIVVLGYLTVTTGWGFLFFWGFYKTIRNFDAFMRQRVAVHFAPIFKPEPVLAEAEFIATYLQREGMGKKGDIEVSNYHIGTYCDCSLKFFNARYTSHYSTGRGGRNKTHNDFLIIGVGVPRAFNGNVYIKRDQGVILNWLRGQYNKKRRFKVSHEGFEEKFEVYADNVDTAKALVTRSFCNNLLAVEKMYPKSMGLIPRRVTGLFANRQFFIIVGGVRDMMSDGISFSHPDKVQQTARRMIARFAIMPRIVDFLHGSR